MGETLVVVSITSLLAAIIGALIALGIQRNKLNRLGAERQAWERAQVGHRYNWEIEHEKHAAELETKLIRQVQQIQKSWEEWEVKDQERLKMFQTRYDGAVAQLEMEHELARLPRVEDTPLTLDAAHKHQYTIPHWQAPKLQGANLSGRDLSHRYLGRADLRGAQLAKTNFYMADLSGAFLTGANLAGADLSGANLAGTDLRDAILTGANLLVADLYGAILTGANLLETRNLTTQQVYTAIYDSTTLFDPALAITPDSPPVMPTPAPKPTVTQKSFDVMSTSTPAAANEPLSITPPETPLPNVPDDAELLIPAQAEPSPQPLLPADDGLFGPVVIDLPGDRQENNGAWRI